MQSSKLGMWKGKGLHLAAEPSRIKLSWVPTGLVIVVYRGSTQHDDCIEECQGGKTTRCTTDSRVSSVDEKFEGATPVSGHQYFCSERLTAWIWRNNKPGDWSEHCCRHHNCVSLGTKRANVGSDIDYFPIAHNTLCLPPKFCITYCLTMLLGKCNTPRSI